MTNRSQNETVLHYLRKVGPLTSLLAFRRWNLLRLSARIWDLKRRGHRIISERRQRGRKHWTRSFADLREHMKSKHPDFQPTDIG